MDLVFRDRQKEIWNEELQETAEKNRTSAGASEDADRSRKLQSLQDKQRNHLKNVCACEEDMQMLRKEMEERKAIFETRIRALSEKSGDSRKAADDL